MKLGLSEDNMTFETDSMTLIIDNKIEDCKYCILEYCETVSQKQCSSPDDTV